MENGNLAQIRISFVNLDILTDAGWHASENNVLLVDYLYKSIVDSTFLRCLPRSFLFAIAVFQQRAHSEILLLHVKASDFSHVLNFKLPISLPIFYLYSGSSLR